MDLVEDICTADDLKRDPEGIFRKLHQTGRPMVVTVDGRPEVIMLPAGLLPSKRTALEAACELASTVAV
ncbi:MAG: hypothetical protein ACYSUQ_14690 [Planctomycetota bacterium]|jgi:hypothetical protein